MEFRTRDFGALTFEEKNIITFPFGLVAFEHLRRFILLEPEENSPWRTLQSVDDGNVSFTVVDPWAVTGRYDPRISQETLDLVGIDGVGEAAFLALAVVPEDIRQTTVNLMAPIVINPKTRQAWQVILDQDDYSLRYPVFGVEEADNPQDKGSGMQAERGTVRVDAILVP